jgi:hypothetical protein
MLILWHILFGFALRFRSRCPQLSFEVCKCAVLTSAFSAVLTHLRLVKRFILDEGLRSFQLPRGVCVCTVLTSAIQTKFAHFGLEIVGVCLVTSVH